jgi:hypothetical protein
MTFKLSKSNDNLLEKLVKQGCFSSKEKAINYAVSQINNYQKSNSINVDLKPALSGNTKCQKDWIEFYNKQEGEAKGKKMITASDIYNAGKSKDLLASLRKDFKDSWIVTGTRILYNKDNLAGKIVHNFNSTIAKPIEIAVAEIPIYQEEKIKNVVEGKGLAYTQAVFNTKDKAVKIIDTLEKLSQKSAEDIIFWTLTRDSRKSYSETAVGFGGYYYIRFHVGGDRDYVSGRSCGVLLKTSGRSPAYRSK